MFLLKDLDSYDGFAIQCHDNPDADAISSAFALYKYFSHAGKAARIFYSGKFEISKPNLLKMLLELNIPLEFVSPGAEKFPVLVTVDCQYGAGNVSHFDADTVIVIDHHTEEKSNFTAGVINSRLGACATLVWDLLRREGFPFGNEPAVSTALYYGLFSDTGGLAEIFHPLDRDMRDTLAYNKIILKSLQNTNLSLGELSIAGAALNNCFVNTELRYAIFKSEPCDPNILGFISDLALQVDGVDTCVVYNVLKDGAKLSVRCCARDVMAADFAEFLTRGVGSGGGHMDKAGGCIIAAKIDASLDDFIRSRSLEYFANYDIVDSASHSLDIAAMNRYRKLKLTVGYARSVDVFPNGTPLSIRALEGDENIIASDEVYIMVGILGEVYPIRSENFRNSYIESTGAFDIELRGLDYSPTVRNINTGEVKEIAEFIKPCTASGEVFIYAKPLERYTKVFTEWNAESYMYGREGDYIAVRADSPKDVYIIRRDIFHMTYEPA